MGCMTFDLQTWKVPKSLPEAAIHDYQHPVYERREKNHYRINLQIYKKITFCVHVLVQGEWKKNTPDFYRLK